MKTSSEENDNGRQEAESDIWKLVEDNENEQKAYSEPNETSKMEELLNEKRQAISANNNLVSKNSDGNLVYIIGQAKELKNINYAFKRQLIRGKSVFHKAGYGVIDFFKINVFGKNYTIDEIMTLGENHLSEINLTLLSMTTELNKRYKGLVNNRRRKTSDMDKRITVHNYLNEKLEKVIRDYNLAKRKFGSMKASENGYFRIKNLIEDSERKRDRLVHNLHLNEENFIDYLKIDPKLEKIEKIISIYTFTSEELIDKTKRILDFIRITKPIYDPLNKQSYAIDSLFNSVNQIENYTYNVQNIVGKGIRKAIGVEKNPRELANQYRDSNPILYSIFNDISNVYDRRLINTNEKFNKSLFNL
ncbi:MAG: hypothetical protein PHV16_00045 [Candidatus Nanoarchaeia archaeon]|nr:hypothetical protein [Candidatus Nanoarchaeia archaeon]